MYGILPSIFLGMDRRRRRNTKCPHKTIAHLERGSSLHSPAALSQLTNDHGKSIYRPQQPPSTDEPPCYSM